ncbi:glycosyltransferase [Paraglaciecola marina]|uniref:glycosyltransferase n=1 Tax=Paraglaciecola marina TaxID=2500157 RepID=UPI00105EB917|nr:glycosyltransferase [Paraglaciecola marina]
MSYKPTYTWPNPAFPFRVYFDSPNCRIFIIENIQHNWNWLSAYASKIKPTDYFFVYCGWYHSPHFAEQADQIFKELKLCKDNFFIMFNSPKEKENFQELGFVGDVINHNAWLDEHLVMQVLPSAEKAYDALYIARLSAFKRHELAVYVNNLALVAGINHGNPLNDNLPPYKFKNELPLKPDEVCIKINESKCGLILSAMEGACFSSSEYLLCGIPVVSTHCEGGRDVWYTNYNSLIVDPDPKKISEAVEYFVKNPRNPYKIRNDHIALAQVHRNKFIDELGNIFFKHGIEIDSRKYFEENYFHKLRKSYAPDFDKIFS